MAGESDYDIQRRIFSEMWHSSPGRFLIILDYDGTLTPIVPDPSRALITESQRVTLESLAANPLVSVYVVSGRDREFLSQQFPPSGIGLVAEHGAFSRQPGSPMFTFSPDIGRNKDWYSDMQVFLEDFAKLIPGTVVERKESCLVWHWRANQEEGSIMAPAIQELLQRRALRQGWQVKVMLGKCIVEVRAGSVTKGAIVRSILADLKISDDGRQPKHILCAGDDTTDEDMFAVLKEANMPSGSLSTIRIMGDDAVPVETAAIRSMEGPSQLWRILVDLEQAIKTSNERP